MSFILPVFWTIIFLFIIWKHSIFKIQGLSQWILPSIFFCKILSSAILHFIYTNYYPDRSTADIFKYFDDAVVLFDSIHHSVPDFLKILFGIHCETPDMFHYFIDTNHWTRMYEYAPFLDNRLIIRINMVILFFSAGNIAVHYIFANFLSLIGFLLIYKTIELFFERSYIALALIFLMPSSLLWTAGILKECIATFAVGCIVYGFFCSCQKTTWKTVLLTICGLALLIIVKFYILAALIPALISYLIVEKLHPQRVFLSYLLLYAAGIFIICILDFGTHTIPFFESFAGKRTDAINTAILYDAQSILPISPINATLLEFVKETPNAIWNVLALPYIWNFKGIVQLFPALESLLFFVLLILTCLFFKKPCAEQQAFIYFIIFFSIVLIWEVGISTPIIGGIVRYKILIFPFLYTTMAMLIDWKKITKKPL
ncbi:MAG: hypothetical protein MJ198_06020 [Bacteroidales bacterium]|nr:hypothetical protein [Bacteroidales bacterium]